jgi:hypothetical protein
MVQQLSDLMKRSDTVDTVKIARKEKRDAHCGRNGQEKDAAVVFELR